MGVAFRAAGAVSSGDTVTSLTLAAPAGTQASDVVLAVLMFGTSITVTPPSGWTLAASVDDALGPKLEVYWGLGSATFGSWSLSAGVTIVGFTVGYTGVDNATPMDATAVGQVNGSTSTPTAPSITTVTASAMLVGFFGTFDPLVGTEPIWSAEFGTHRQSGGIQGSADTVSVDTAEAVQESPGPSGTKTATINKLLRNNGILTALRPGLSITTQPQDAGKNAGSTVSFSVTATGTGTLHYQWKRAERDSTTFSNVGTDSASYTTGTLTVVGDNGAHFQVVVTDDNGSTTSRSALLEVGPANTFTINDSDPVPLALTFQAAASALTWTINDSDPSTLAMTFHSPAAAAAWSWLLGMAHFPSPSGSAFTLNAGSGVYTITGMASALLHGALVKSNAGVYTITGFAATLRKASLINAGAGAYSQTGFSASFYLGKFIVAAAGSYTISGSSASLLTARQVNAAAGAYTISGASAAVLVGRIMSALAGAYALTGAAATLMKGFSFNAAAGTYAISGADAFFTVERFLQAAPGLYALTGFDASFDTTAAQSADWYRTMRRRR